METSRHGSIVSFVEIKTPDSELLARFYSKVFGWNTESDGASSYRMLSPATGGHIASISGPDGTGVGPPEQWLPWIQVDDVDVAVRVALNHDGSIFKEVQDIGNGERIAVMRDPIGAFVGLLEAKK